VNEKPTTIKVPEKTWGEPIVGREKAGKRRDNPPKKRGTKVVGNKAQVTKEYTPNPAT